ncbi:hypothetical protein GCM10028818_07180 [Spirosoma horti]
MDDLINQLPCGVIRVSEDSSIISINSTAEQHLGYAPSELAGKHISQILTKASLLFYHNNFYPLVNHNGRADEVALTLLTRHGEQIPILLNAVGRQHNKAWEMNCAYLPIGQRQSYETELIQARKSAEQARFAVERSEANYRALATALEIRVAERTQELLVANTDLSDLNAELNRSNENLQRFAYVASHDLQEPMRKIQAFAELLKDQYADKLGEGIGLLDRMYSASGRMSTLISDLLAFATISTKQDVQAEVDLSEVVKLALADLEMRIQETGAVIHVDQLPTLLGDATQLGQLFLNLISNALKFRQPGISPVIQLNTRYLTAKRLPASIRPARTARAYYCITVADNGIGFDEKYLDRIFQVFQRLHRKKDYSGTGIGLAICEKVVSNHGGAITATSQLGHGATFHVYLPV